MTATSTISDYETYVNLQMLTEAVKVEVGGIPTGKGGWADFGDTRSNRTPCLPKVVPSTRRAILPRTGSMAQPADLAVHSMLS